MMGRLLATTASCALLCAGSLSAGPNEYLLDLEGAERFKGAIMITDSDAVAYKKLEKQLHFKDLSGKKKLFTGSQFDLRPGTLSVFGEKGTVPIYEGRVELAVGPYFCNPETNTFSLLVAPMYDSRLEREVSLKQGDMRKVIRVNDPVFDEEFACGKYDLVSRILYKGEIFDELIIPYGE